METQASTRPTYVQPPLRAALSWRLLLSWTVAMLIPSAIVMMPLSNVFGELFDMAARGDELARKINPLLLADATSQLRLHSEWMAGAFTLATIAMLLLSPLCAGLAVTSYPEPPPTLFGLLQGAVGNYPRLFRLMLVSIIPFGVAGMIGMTVSGMVEKSADKAILESSATTSARLSMALTVLVVLLAQLTIEAARAQMAANAGLRSALRAWVRGLKMIAARPGAVLARYLGPTLVSVIMAAVLAVLRIRVDNFLIGFLITQLAVAAIGWGRAGRIFALAGLARELDARR